MSIPLIQKPEKDDINTSIIAIKRNIERINMLLGLVDNDSPDLSGFATKQELQEAVTELQPVDEVTVGNMQSVSSNAVAEKFEVVDISNNIGNYNYYAKSVKKVDNIVYVNLELFLGNAGLTPNAKNILGYIPEGFRPKVRQGFCVMNCGASDGLPIQTWFGYITTDGEFGIYTGNAQLSFAYFTISYLID